MPRLAFHIGADHIACRQPAAATTLGLAVKARWRWYRRGKRLHWTSAADGLQIKVCMANVRRTADTDSSFCPLHMLSPSPDALRNSDLVDVVHRESDEPRVDARKLVASVGWRDASQMPFALLAYLLAVGLVSSGLRPFLTGPLPPPPPHLTSHSPAMGRKGFYPTKTKQKGQRKYVSGVRSSGRAVTTQTPTPGF